MSVARPLCLSALLVTLLGPVLPVSAWSYKEHILFVRLAAARLLSDPQTPPDMKAWLREAVPDATDMNAAREFFIKGTVGTNTRRFAGVSLYAVRPDEHALTDPIETRVPGFGVHEKRLHYIDLEFFLTGDAKREYRDDLSGKPPPGAIPRDINDKRFVQAGMLPFRVQHC